MWKLNNLYEQMLKTVMLVSFLFDLFKHIYMLEIIVTLFFFSHSRKCACTCC